LLQLTFQWAFKGLALKKYQASFYQQTGSFRRREKELVVVVDGVCVKVHLFFSFIQHAENLYSAKNLATQNSYCPGHQHQKNSQNIGLKLREKKLDFLEKRKKTLDYIEITPITLIFSPPKHALTCNNPLSLSTKTSLDLHR
jgi:hypothetical protein